MEPRAKRQPRTRFVSLAIPGDLGEELDELKYACQESGIRITERQSIGRNGIVLAALAVLDKQGSPPEAKKESPVKRSRGLSNAFPIGIIP